MLLSSEIFSIETADDLAPGGAEGLRFTHVVDSFGNDGIDSGNELAEVIRAFFFMSNDNFDGLDIPTADL